MIQEINVLEEVLKREPGNTEGWSEIARLVRRSGHELDLTRKQLQALYEIRAKAPEDRAILELVLRQLGMRLGEKTKPSLWWKRNNRAEDRGDYWSDKKTGMPLEVVHEKTGMEMVLVPRKKYNLHSGYTMQIVDFQLRPKDVVIPHFYIARFPVLVEQYMLYDPDIMKRNRTNLVQRFPVKGISHVESAEYCDWAGLELPYAVEKDASLQKYDSGESLFNVMDYELFEWCADKVEILMYPVEKLNHAVLTIGTSDPHDNELYRKVLSVYSTSLARLDEYRDCISVRPIKLLLPRMRKPKYRMVR